MAGPSGGNTAGKLVEDHRWTPAISMFLFSKLPFYLVSSLLMFMHMFGVYCWLISQPPRVVEIRGSALTAAFETGACEQVSTRYLIQTPPHMKCKRLHWHKRQGSYAYFLESDCKRYLKSRRPRATPDRPDSSWGNWEGDAAEMGLHRWWLKKSGSTFWEKMTIYCQCC